MTTIVTRGSNYQVKVRVKGFPTATEPIKTEKSLGLGLAHTYAALRNNTFMQPLQGN